MREFAQHFLLTLKTHSLYVYFFIFLVSFSESFAFVGLVVPGAVFAVSAGYLAYKGYFNLYLLMFAGAMGAIGADVASYYLGKVYGYRLEKSRWYEKYMDYFEAGKSFFKKHGGKSVFLGRFVGALRPVIPFLAGMLEMNSVSFYFWAVTSGILWAVLYMGAGYLLGGSVELFERWSSWMRELNYAGLAVAFGVVLLYLLRRKNR